MIPLTRPVITASDRERVDAVLASRDLVQGTEVAAFEEEFADHVAGRHTVTVNSGTAGLITALMSTGVSRGDEVIVPSFTFAATVNAVHLVGAKPVFADIDPATFCLSPRAVEAAVSERTAAVLPVHLYGHPAPMVEICEIAARAGIIVIEDACQALDATLDGDPVGTFGEAAVFSFYATKHITAGEGGAVVFRSGDLAARCRAFRNQGLDAENVGSHVGYNFRMTDIAAALARGQLARADDMLTTRREHAGLLDRGLRGVTTPTVAPGVEHAYGNYTVRTRHRDRIVEEVRRRDVDARIYYATPVHGTPAYCSVNGGARDLVETERASAEVISLPVGPHLSDSDVERVVTVVNEVVNE